MPTYEYACSNCGFHFEEFQSMKEDALIKCPNCGQNKLKRLIGAGTGVIFKGSGFYITDYKKGNSSTKSTSSKKDRGEKKEVRQTKETSETKPKEKSKEKKNDSKSK